MTAVQYTVAQELPIMLINGQFDDLWMPERTRCEVIVRAWKHQPEHANFQRMVKAHITQVFPYLLDEPECIRYLMDDAMITNENIAECIRIAKEHNAHELETLFIAKL